MYLTKSLSRIILIKIVILYHELFNFHLMLKIFFYILFLCVFIAFQIIIISYNRIKEVYPEEKHAVSHR